MPLDIPNVERVPEAKTSLDNHERRALADLLRDPQRAALAAEKMKELQEHADFRETLKGLWEGSERNIRGRVEWMKDSKSIEGESLRNVMDVTGKELETLFAAARTLKEAGVEVSDAEAALHKLSQDFIDACTAENVGDAATETKTHYEQVTIHTSLRDRVVNKKVETKRNVGLEASLKLVEPVLASGTADQALNWLKDVHLRISKDGWQNGADAQAYRKLTNEINDKVLQRLVADKRPDLLLDFARTVTGRNGSVDKNLVDTARGREAVMAAMDLQPAGTDGKSRRSLMEKLVPDLPADPVVAEMGGPSGVVGFFKEGLGAERSSEYLKTLRIINVDEWRGLKWNDLTQDQRGIIMMAARVGKEMAAQVEKVREPILDNRDVPEEQKGRIIMETALANACDKGKVEGYAKEVSAYVQRSVEGLEKALNARSTAFGNIAEGSDVSPQDRELMTLAMDMMGSGALNFSDESLSAMTTVAKVAASILASIAVMAATGGVGAGPIIAALMASGMSTAAATAVAGGIAAGVVGGTTATVMSVGLNSAEGRNMVQEEVLTEGLINIPTGGIGGGATGYVLSAVGRSAMAAQLVAKAFPKGASAAETLTAKKAVDDLSDAVAKAAAKGASEAEKKAAEAAARKFAQDYQGVSLKELADAGATKLATIGTNLGAGLLDATAGMGAETLRQNLLLDNPVEFLETIKSGGPMAFIMLAAGNAGAARSLRGPGAKPNAVPSHSASQAESLGAMPVTHDAVFIPPTRKAKPASDLNATMFHVPGQGDALKAPAAKAGEKITQKLENLTATKGFLEERADKVPAHQKAVLGEGAKIIDKEIVRLKRAADMFERQGFQPRQSAATAPTERLANPAQKPVEAPSPSASRPAPERNVAADAPTERISKPDPHAPTERIVKPSEAAPLAPRAALDVPAAENALKELVLKARREYAANRGKTLEQVGLSDKVDIKAEMELARKGEYGAEGLSAAKDYDAATNRAAEARRAYEASPEGVAEAKAARAAETARTQTRENADKLSVAQRDLGEAEARVAAQRRILESRESDAQTLRSGKLLMGLDDVASQFRPDGGGLLPGESIMVKGPSGGWAKVESDGVGGMRMAWAHADFESVGGKIQLSAKGNSPLGIESALSPEELGAAGRAYARGETMIHVRVAGGGLQLRIPGVERPVTVPGSSLEVESAGAILDKRVNAARENVASVQTEAGAARAKVDGIEGRVNGPTSAESAPRVEFAEETVADDVAISPAKTQESTAFEIDFGDAPTAKPKRYAPEFTEAAVSSPKRREREIRGGETVDRTNLEYFFEGSKPLSGYAPGERLTLTGGKGPVSLVARGEGRFHFPEKPDQELAIFTKGDVTVIVDADTQQTVKSLQSARAAQTFDAKAEAAGFGKFDDSGVDKAVAEGKLNDSQLAELTRYMESGFADTNKSLRSGAINYRNDVFSATVNRALDQLPEVRGTVFRGVDTAPQRVREFYAQRYVKGAVVEENGFTSCSEQRAIAKGFAEQSKKGGIVIFEIESAGGARSVKNVRIANFGEQEALFKAGARFEVTDQAQIGDNGLYIKMREVGPADAQSQSVPDKIAQ